MVLFRTNGHCYGRNCYICNMISVLDKSKISEARTFKSDLKVSLGIPFENKGLVLMLCTEGCAVLSIDFKEYPFKKGDIAIIPEGMSLIPIQTSSLFQTEIICVEARHCEEMEYKITDMCFWNFLMEHPVLHPTTVQHKMLCSWFSHMKWIMEELSYPFFNETISSSISILFMLMYREVKALCKESDKDQTSNRTQKIFTDFTNLVIRYHKRHREVAFYASQLSITPDYLNKVCKTDWNTSAKEYIDWYVVMAIKNFLTCTDLSIKCIAAQLNFEDSSYMCRFFKKQTGLTPIQFRNNER